MILHICYNDSCHTFPDKIKEICPEQITVETYDENNYHEKKKAYKIKGGYSARKTPFMLLTEDDKSYVKAFYSEDNGCSVDNLLKFLKSLNHESTNN